MTPPTGYTKKNTEDLFFQKMADAGAAGDLGGQIKPYDRAGLSRGSAQKSQAGVRGAQALADGVADAYRVPATDAAQNSQSNLQYQVNNENYNQGLTAIAQQDAYSRALDALSRQQTQASFAGNALSGLLGTVGSAIGSVNNSSGGMGGMGGTGGTGGNWLDDFLGF